MRADVAAEGKGFGGGTATGTGDVLAMLFDQTEQVWWMHGVMGHAHEIGLREIIHFRGLEQGEKIGSHDY